MLFFEFNPSTEKADLVNLHDRLAHRALPCAKQHENWQRLSEPRRGR